MTILSNHAYTKSGEPLCETPGIRRSDKRTGTLWGCPCGRIYRVISVGSIGGTFWSWEFYGEVQR